MARIAALVRKELRQHLVAGVALAALLTGGLFVLLGSLALLARQNLSLLMAHVWFLWIFAWLAGVVLGNRLVVAEYHARTQLFVESLPVRRWEMVATKYGLGLSVLLAAAGGSLVACSVAASFSEPVDAPFLAILATRTCAFVFALWSVLFAMGFTGRFRIPIYLGLGLGLAVLGGMTDFDLRRFGPVAVASPQTMAHERVVLPVRAITESLAFGSAWTVTAFALALIREGSVAESLARRMSQKEKSLVGMLFLGLIVAVSFLDRKKTKQPLTFSNERYALTSAHERLEVLFLHGAARADAEALLAALEADLVGLRRALDWQSTPPLRVALREGLDPGTFERGWVSKRDGVLLRANFRQGARWDAAAFRARAVRELLIRHTDGRANFETRAWFLDGFSRWWCEGSRPHRALADDRALLRGVWAGRTGLDREWVERWFQTRERHGRDLAEGLAYTGVRTLERLAGREAVMGLAHAFYSAEVPKDSRETLREWGEPSAAVLARVTGQPLDAFVQAWSAELQRLRLLPEVADRLARIPEARGAIETRRREGTIRELAAGVEFAAPLVRGTTISLVHHPLSPFEREIYPYELIRVERTAAAGDRSAEATLLGRYGPGSRVFVALEMESSVLGCPVRLIAQRRAIE